MGCAQSRIENEESVSRCKERKQHMKDAVVARNAFAAAHSSYAMALKNTGAALSDFAHGESPALPASSLPSSSSASAAAAAAAATLQPPMETPLPPPPPLPDFSPSPLQRASSMPLPAKKFPSKLRSDPSIREEEDDDEDGEHDHDHDHDHDHELDQEPKTPPPPPLQHSPAPPPPMPESTWDYFFAPIDENMAGTALSQHDEIRPEVEEERFRKLATPNLTASIPRNVASGDGEEPPVTPEKLVSDPPVPMPARKQKQGVTPHHQHAASASAIEARRGKMVTAPKSSITILQVLSELDDHFLRASQGGHEVSKMLEANRMHYHSNFADNRGHIDHSARVMKVITWNRSFKGLPNANDGKDEFDDDEWETHATVLDKMLAWEKKLYDEVKAGELMKIEYQRKVALLNKQKKRAANPEAIEKTKASVSHLHTRYIVDMQSMDSTVSEIQCLRDEQLYRKLVELVDGMAKMWEAMHMQHESQLRIVSDLRDLDISNSPKETSEHHYDRTVQLWQVVREWHSQFQKLISHQKEYIQALNSWLKLNLIPIESSLKEKVSSPPRVHQPPIQTLLHTWYDYLEKLPDDLAKSAISSFAAVINTIMLLQQDELKQREKCEETRKEYMRKTRSFEDWYHKHSQRRAGQPEEADPENSEMANQKDPVTERKFIVESLKSRLDDEIEAHQKLCRQVREKSLGSLKTHLPELFRAMSDFSHACSIMYKRLRPASQMQNPPMTN
ncbi:hypothetical protein J5N97_015114 [Dioscorea zingiberensis]|uniref:Nitrate regulatory gene2 protein-like n=1 Tax=Dioscorea zingiberensis TaxID=325984 RepID=A0A9D5CTL5_9LILI|nr:hypothetical protein J5N97_015114 [Dioscorea zingiberensis]